jgi:hypothetical protein
LDGTWTGLGISERAKPRDHVTTSWEANRRLSQVFCWRTGKIGLNHYLSTINRADEPLCPCRQAPETTHHVLFGCTRYNDLRQATWTEGTPRDLREALTEKQYVRRAARFMLSTGRLTYLADATQPAWLEPIAPSSDRLLTALVGDG